MTVVVLDALGRIKEYWGELALADLADFTRGDIIRGGAADWESYPVGAANEVLTNDGTDVFWSAGGLDLTAGGDLVVGANSWVDQDLRIAASPTFTTLTLSDAAAPELSVVDTTNNATVKVQATNTLGKIGTSSNHDLEIIANSATRIFVDAATGFVGIGGASSQRLELFGAQTTLTLDVDSWAGISAIYTANATSSFDINNTAVGGDLRLYATEDIHFRTATVDPAVIILKAGNFGIGTVPDELLHLKSGASANAYLKMSATSAGFNTHIYGDVDTGAADYIINSFQGRWNGTEVARIAFETGDDTGNKDDGRITFWTAPAGTVIERVRIKPDGGTIIKMDGASGASTQVLVLQNDEYSGSVSGGLDLDFKTSGGTVVSKLRSSVIASGDFAFQVFNWDGAALQPRITIRESGRIGFNVLAPLAQLHVDQSVNDAAIPVLILDQADISEGFINFIGSDRGVITGATNSLKSVRVELGGVVYRIALYVDG